MPTFRYEAIDPAGNTVRSSMTADSKNVVLQRMRELRFHPVDVSIMRDGTTGGSLAELNKRLQRVKLKELVIFTRQFSTMIDAGMTILKCLDILEKQIKNPFFKETIQAVKLDIAAGAPLADALAKHPRIFNDLYVNMVRAAELGGILDTILRRISTYLENEQEIRTKIKSAMMYPCIVFAFAILMTAGIVFIVLPRFKKIFGSLLGDDPELPMVTVLLLDAGEHCKNYWFVPVILIVGFVVALKLIGRTDSGRYRIDAVKLKLPLLGGLALKIAVSRVCRTLGTLLASGVTILRCLEIVEQTAGNAVIAGALRDARTAVHGGERICEPLAQSGIFPLMVTQMIQIGEETGRLDDMLNKVAIFYEEEVDAMIKGLTSLIEPIMIMGLGGFVMFVAVAVLKPVYGVLGQIE